MSSDLLRALSRRLRDLPGVWPIAAMLRAVRHAGFGLGSNRLRGAPALARSAGLARALHLIRGGRLWGDVHAGGLAVVLHRRAPLCR